MKKLFVIALSVLFTAGIYAQSGGTGTQNTQGTQGTERNQGVQGTQSTQGQSTYGVDNQDDMNKERRQITFAELPQAVKDELSKSEYNKWTNAETATEIRDTEKGETYYEVTLTNPSNNEIKVVKFDSEGKVKDKDKNKDKNKQRR